MEAFNKLVNLFTHDYYQNLARQLHIKTDLPIYAIYDPTAKVCSWGIDYFHFFVKVSDDCYLNARGLQTEKEMIAFWAAAWKDSTLLENVRIIHKEPEHLLTGDASIDRLLEENGSGMNIHPHTVEFADLLIRLYL